MVLKTNKASKTKAQIVTVGTTYGPSSNDVIAALARDLKKSGAGKLVIIATEDSKENAERLQRSSGFKPPETKVRLLNSAESLDESYKATNEEILQLLEDGVLAENMVLHYTGGTKVMSAGAVLAAVNNDVRSLRYLYSPPGQSSSRPVITESKSVMGDRKLRMSITMIQELRFRTAGELLSDINKESLLPQRSDLVSALQTLSSAYEDWDRFQLGDFVTRYKSISQQLQNIKPARHFKVSAKQLKSIEKAAAAMECDGDYPDEILIDVYNNALRRLSEKRPDDALIRLHRAAEVFAQSILHKEYGIRTDDLEIRKVPPRSRDYFEAERRLEDAKIKLGLRKSYELLEILGNPVGQDYRQSDTFRKVLSARRNLILAHGTRPATMRLAYEFLVEIESLFQSQIKDFRKRASELQFPWISNRKIYAFLSTTAKKRKVPSRKSTGH